MSLHPNESTLALFAADSGGDLELLERARVALHLRRCAGCRQQVSDFQALRADLASMRERSTGPLGDWDRLSDEMTANIRLGLSMAECVGPAPRQRRRKRFLWLLLGNHRSWQPARWRCSPAPLC